MSPIQQMLLGVGAVATKTYVDDIFSTFLYKGTGSTITINNGIDLSGEGGVVFIKRRDSSGAPYVFDTIRGANQAMMTNDQQADFTLSNSLTAFNSNGFTIGTSSNINTSGATYVGWTLRKADKLFTMGTYTGNGGTSQTISHNLGVTPSMIWVKMTSTNESWYVYHKDMGNGSPQNNANEHQMRLDSYAARSSDQSQWWNDTSPTASQFTVGSSSGLNANNSTFQYYLFAHDQQEFGENDSHSIFKFGHYQGNGSSLDINLGYEPQWIFIKCSQGWSNKDWQIIDSMRGAVSDGNDQLLQYNTGAAESSATRLNFTATGFTVATGDAHFNDNGSQYIYWAIRRPDGYVGKPPELGSEVFSMNSGANSGAPLFDSTHVVDYQFVRNINSTWNWETGARLIGSKQVYLNTTGAETNIDPNGWKYDYMNGWHTNASGISNYMCWMFKRHAGFTVCTWEGDGVAGRQIAHDMNKTVEMLWLKNRSSSSHNWMCYHKGLNGGTNPEDYFLRLNTADAEGSSSTYLNSTAPTSTNITLGSINAINANGSDFIAMLFASVDGISKVGYFDGSDSNQTITTGFQPRFLIIKNVTTGGEGYWWYVFDTVRGWDVSSGVKYLTLDRNTAQADTLNMSGNPTSTGFSLTGNKGGTNDAGQKYIYYCHA